MPLLVPDIQMDKQTDKKSKVINYLLTALGSNLVDTGYRGDGLRHWAQHLTELVLSLVCRSGGLQVLQV